MRLPCRRFPLLLPFLLLLAAFLCLACNPVQAPPAGAKDFEQGNVRISTADCAAAPDSQVLRDLCSILTCTPQGTCGNRTEELFTGDSLLGISKPGAWWTYMGGRGQLMAEGALCALRDLANGAVENSAAATLLGGSLRFTIDQQVGFAHFDPTQRTFTGYQTARVCVPVIGCFESIRQAFSAQVVESQPANPGGLTCGEYKIANGFGLQVTADEIDQSMSPTLPSLVVDTPYGEVTVTPTMTYTVQTQSILMPLGVSVPARLLPNGASESITDLLGRIPGTLATSQMQGSWGFPNLGWQSQVALGGRDASDNQPIWTGTGFRPDLDLGLPRNDAEHIPNVLASAGLHVDYSPTDMIPSFLKSPPLSVDLHVHANTDMTARFAEQLAIFFGETFNDPTDLGVPFSATMFQLKTRAQAAASLTENAGIDLEVVATFLLGSKTLLEIHPNVSVPLDTGTPGDAGQDLAWGVSGSDPANDGGHPTMGLWTSNQQEVADPKGFVAACLAASAPADQAPPAQLFQPGNATVLAPSLFPCDICIGSPVAASDPNKGQSIGAMAVSIFPALQPADWDCIPTSIGCFDLCSFDAIPKILIRKWTASQLDLHDLNGLECGHHPEKEPH